jgi:hypothetical protein
VSSQSGKTFGCLQVPYADCFVWRAAGHLIVRKSFQTVYRLVSVVGLYFFHTFTWLYVPHFFFVNFQVRLGKKKWFESFEWIFICKKISFLGLNQMKYDEISKYSRLRLYYLDLLFLESSLKILINLFISFDESVVKINRN